MTGVPLAAAVVALALAAPAAALELDVPRISRQDCRYAAHAVFDTFAGARGERLTIGPCNPAGRLSRACVVRIGGHERWRLVVRYASVAREPVASTRRLPDRPRGG